MADDAVENNGMAPAERACRSPGPDYPIRIEPHDGRIVVHAEDQVIADSASALILYEANQPPAVYFPRADVDMNRLIRSDMSTFSPYKGECTYYALDDGESANSIAWSYERPAEAVAAIAGHLSFLPDRVDLIGLKALDSLRPSSGPDPET